MIEINSTANNLDRTYDNTLVYYTSHNEVGNEKGLETHL